MAQQTLTPGPGTVVRDAIGPVLFNAQTVAGTANGTAVQVNWPCHVRAELTVGAMGGTSAVVDIEIQGADNAAFDSNVVTLGVFDVLNENSDNQTREMDLYILKKYVRAAITTASGSPTGNATVKLVPMHDRRSLTDTA